MFSYRNTCVAIAVLLCPSFLLAQRTYEAADNLTMKDLPSGITRLTWTAEEPSCDSSVSYSVYRDTKSDFAPSQENQIASGVTTTHFDIRGDQGKADRFYRVAIVKGPAAKVPAAGKPLGQPGSIRGRVFAITEGGDIKPARLVTVYLVFEARIIGHQVDDRFGCEKTADIVFMEKRLESKERRDNGDSCKKDLLDDMNGIVGMLDWVVDSHSWQVVSSDADEEGNFAFPKVSPGKYDILVHGRAGINEAFWNQEVWVQPGQYINVKVANIEHSCSDLE